MGLVATLAQLALWIFKALGWANNLAERRAGAAEYENEAYHEEINRNARASDAADAARLPIDTPDPYDRDGH